MMFSTLVGFKSHSDLSENKRSDTFLSACGEYCPVDQLLEDEVKALSKIDKQSKFTALKKYKARCPVLFCSLQGTIQRS